MPRFDLFQKLPLLSYVDRVHIRYNPGSPNSETCRRLLMTLMRPETARKFPGLSYTYELLSYNDRPEIALTLSSEVSHRYVSFSRLTKEALSRFYADTCSLDDIHRAIDKDQYQAHANYLKSRSLEAPVE